MPGLRDPNADDAHATLTEDELTVYFASNRSGYSTTKNIYRASRPTRDAPFSTPMAVLSLSTPDGENNPAISADGNTIYFDRYKPNLGMQLLVSTRSSATVVFPEPTVLDAKNLAEPSLTADGKVLYAANLETGLLARLENDGNGFGAALDVDTQLAYTQLSPATMT